MMPTRPQRAYDPNVPPAQPTFTPAQPTFTRGFAPQMPPQPVPFGPPPQFTGGYPPPTHRRPRNTRRNIMITGSVIFAVAVALVVLGHSSSPSGPPYVTQLQKDGYTLTQQGTLTGGEGIGWAEGNSGTGAGELVVQAKSTDDAQGMVNALQGNSDGAAVTSDGDLLIIQNGSYSAISALVSSEGW